MRSCARDTLAMLATTGQSEDGSPTWRAPSRRTTGSLNSAIVNLFVTMSAIGTKRTCQALQSACTGKSGDPPGPSQYPHLVLLAAPIAACVPRARLWKFSGELSQHTLL